MITPERPIVLHKGVYKRTATWGESVFMITGMTIGAGVLGLPFVVAQVGVKIGLVYIAILGLIMLFLNLIIGEIAVRTGASLQLPGFAGKYLGKWAQHVLSIIVILSGVGVLLAYIVGESQTLSALFGGDYRYWGLGFWCVGALLIWRGLETIKSVEKVLSLIVMIIIAALSFYLLPQAQMPNLLLASNWTNLFLPFGVILFALHASPAIVEAHALLPGSQKHYRKAVIIGTLLPVILYMLFAAAVVGISGADTTQIATVGLGAKFGGWIFFAGNLFAILAMGTGFMGMGMALKQSLMWDNKLNQRTATFLVAFVPMILFLSGLNNFVLILDVVGGLFIGIEAVLMVLACAKARERGDIDGSRYGLKYFWPIAVPVLIVFSIASVVSVAKLFA